MPCNSDHMEANGREKALSEVASLIDELDGVTTPQSFRDGYHPKVYCKSHTVGDALVRNLCGRLQVLDVTKYSLEMQIWWRDHQAADLARLEKEISDALDADARKAALDKLTEYEKKLLGLSEN